MVESNNQPTKWSGCLQGSCQKMLRVGGATNSHKVFYYYYFLLVSNGQTFSNNMKLKALKVRPKKLLEASPCIGEMGAMLECWSRSGVDDPRCAQTAKALANCMSKPVSTAVMRGIDHLEIG